MLEDRVQSGNSAREASALFHERCESGKPKKAETKRAKKWTDSGFILEVKPKSLIDELIYES
jgi:hypothetical protein